MPHHSRLRMIVIDLPEQAHDDGLAFWQAAVGQELNRIEDHPEYHGALLPHQQHVGLLVQHLGDGPARVHLDIHTDDLAAETARLERLGATRVRRIQDWQVMRDPANLVFCVVAVPAGTLDENNARRWD